MITNNKIMNTIQIVMITMIKMITIDGGDVNVAAPAILMGMVMVVWLYEKF